MTAPKGAATKDVGGGGVNRLTLKWGTAKGWELHSEAAVAALQKWADFGVSMSAMAHRDTPEQKEALLAAIDHMDEIYLDWDDKYVTREEAKEYVRNYGKPAALSEQQS